MKTADDLKEEIKRIEALDVEGFDNAWVLRKFARDQALINIKLIKPYTDKYSLIVTFLVTGKDAHAATGAADATPADSAAAAAFDSSYGAASIDSAADSAFDSAYEAASAYNANAANAAYYATTYATYDADYTKAIESLATLADEYLALLSQKAGDDI